MQNKHTLQKQLTFWIWFPKVSKLQGISQSLIRIHYPSTWHFSEMSIPPQSCSFVQNRFIDILLHSLSIPPVAWFCFITHQKGRMLRAPHAWLRAGGLNSCKWYGITGGTSSKQMSQKKKKNRGKKERGVKRDCGLGTKWEEARHSRARPDLKICLSCFMQTLVFFALLTIMKV